MEKKRIRLGVGQVIPIVLTKEEENDLRREITQRNALSKARKMEAQRRKVMDICIDSDESCVCGCNIIYSSAWRFIPTGPMQFGNGPADGYHRETRKAACSSCGLLYDHTHSRFSAVRARVAAMRQPPGDDWEPPAPPKEKRGKVR